MLLLVLFVIFSLTLGPPSFLMEKTFGFICSSRLKPESQLFYVYLCTTSDYVRTGPVKSGVLKALPLLRSLMTGAESFAESQL